ncbi:UBX domain-containing protein [Heracleum sosnowskyi]|uniref:UBX domain-containing protein n=1 Tax=Heracleum sosnowskyi TaxID=360622 RepID=A0AAD8NE39_9APIA|nr:UBX domain-containing protein [Heracleum sosnowskyi]
MTVCNSSTKLEAAKLKLGRDIRVFETSINSQTQIHASNNGCNPGSISRQSYIRSDISSTSETIQLLYDILKKVLACPELPFYLYITPPKKQIKDMSRDFYSAGFAPVAIVYFSQDLPKDDNEVNEAVPFLQEEIISLTGLKLIAEQVERVQPTPESLEPVVETPSPAVKEQKSADKKTMKPKWLKM